MQSFLWIGLLFLVGPSVSPAWAEVAATTLPSGASVVAGQASVATSGAQMNVTQTTQQAIINWNSFNIGSKAGVTFVQPNSSSSTLNRVLSSDASQIMGTLSANGKIFLINPNGIVFGNGAQVNAGGLVASTLDITNEDFLNQNYKFSRNGATGEVTNNGTLVAAPGGYVALIGAKVTNAGTIKAPAGIVAAVAGETVKLPLTDSGLITIDVDPAEVEASVTNTASGVITAEDGQVYLAANAASAVASSVLNKGSVRAKTVTVSAPNGTAFIDEGSSVTANTIKVAASTLTGNGNLTASGDGATITGEAGYISLGGTLSASNGSGTGGTIKLSGRTALLLPSTSAVIANGKVGGQIQLLSNQGFVLVSGSVAAIGSAGTGGTIYISGASSSTLLGGTISANGTSGGGTVYIGGGWHGATITINGEILPLSNATTLDSKTIITASATVSGYGGEVVLWSAETTEFYGSITARGGPSGGTGGNVELSSGGTLTVQLSKEHGIDVLSPAGGVNGNILLDPADIVIGTAASSFDIFKALLTSGGTLSGTSTLSTSSYFGSSVALNSKYALIGAYGANGSGDAYLYNLTTGAWTDLLSTTGAPTIATSSYFGSAVALSDTYALIGASNTTSATGAAYLYNLSTGAWTSLLSTTGAPTIATSSYFGYAVALSDTYALIGANWTTSSTGAAYLYNLATGAWVTLLSTTGAPTIASGSYFGNAVALNDTYALIGAWASSTTSLTGAAYLYNLSTGAWTTLLSTTGAPTIAANTRFATSGFGHAVALNETYALIGASNTTSYTGAAYLYNLATGAWTTLLSTTGAPTIATSSRFGYAVALNDTYALIGAYGTTSYTGAAYLYNLSTGAWTTLLSTTGAPTIATSSRFGSAVALNDTYALIGADGADSYTGAAYLYNLSTGAWTTFLSTTRTPTIATYSNFGSAVALNATYALIGAYGTSSSTGAAYLYNLMTGTWVTLLSTTGAPTIATGSYFGKAVALNGAYALIGAYYTTSGTGAAYLYNLTTGTWKTLLSTTGAPTIATSSYFGSAVALSDTYALIGASNTTSGMGAAYLYNLSTGAWTSLLSTTGAPTIATSSYFGSAVALNETYALIGAYGATSQAGAAYLYNLTTRAWTTLLSTTGAPAIAADAFFGHAVALNDTYALIGAFATTGLTGAAYLYNLSTGEWTTLLSTTGAPTIATVSCFGGAVALSDTYALIGAYGTSSSTGAAYLYNLSTGAWTTLLSTTGAPVIATGSNFGSAVALNNTYALIGAYGTSSSTGAAYLYNLTTGTWASLLSTTTGAPSIGTDPNFGNSVALNETYVLIGAGAGAAYLYNLTTGAWTTLLSTTGAPTIASESRFGWAVALSDTYALIGAYAATSDTGAAYLYNLLTGVWTTLLSTTGAPTMATYSNFGSAVALNATYALIGAYGTSSSTGAAYLYNLSTGAWTTLLSTTGAPTIATSSYYGAVALNNNYALIGAYGTTSYTGEAYLYNLSTGAWTTLLSTTGAPTMATGSEFGYAVALNDTYALIGAYGTTSSTGAAYLYNLSTGAWKTLLSTTGAPSIATNSAFGLAVALSDTYALIGAYYTTTFTGAAYLYNLSTGAWTTLLSTINAPTMATYSYFGYAVALNDTYALIGAYGTTSGTGAAYLYNLSTGKWTNLLSTGTSTIAASSAFGSAVALNDTYALIGAYGTASSTGAAYLYNLSTGVWTTLLSSASAPNVATGSDFGYAVALSDTYALIGAYGTTTNTGAAYLYNLTTGKWTTLLSTSGAPTMATNSYFGYAVALNSTYALIGAIGVNDYVGAAYLYNLSTGGWTTLLSTTGAPTIATNSYFGYAVALNETYALIGAATLHGYSETGAYLYNLSTGVWTTLLSTAGAPTVDMDTSFGSAVALNNNYALIGAYNEFGDTAAAYLYNLSTGAWVTLLSTSGAPSISTAMNYGIRVAISSTYVVIGCADVGDVYLYKISSGTWTDLANVSGSYVPGLSAGSYFGAAVAISDNYVLIGAPGVSASRGNAYLFDLSGLVSGAITSATIQAALATGNVTLVADNSITINTLILTSANSGNTLTLIAGGSIIINSDIQLGDRAVTFIANAASSQLGTASLRASGAASITLSSGASITDTNGSVSLLIETAAVSERSGEYALAGDFVINGAITASSILINGAESGVTLTAALTASASGTAVTIVSSSFAASGSGSIVTASGRWVIYNAQSASLGTVSLGAISSSYNRYGCTYVGGCTTGAIIPTSGSGVVYAYAPTVTISGLATVSKTYDATANVDVSGASLSGLVNGDSLTLTGTYASKNVGSGIALTYALSTEYGYLVSGGASTGSITPATLTVTGVTASSKVYDATTAANVNASSVSMVGVLGSDAVSLVTSGASGTFADKNVGTSKSVSVSGLSLSGADAGNYVVSADAATADITAATLTVTGVTAGNKVYDATAAANVNTSSASLTGILGSDAVSLVTSGASGAFADKNVGTAKSVTVSGLNLSGTDASNYVVVQPTSATADITAATLTVTGVTAGSKVYDATTAANVNTSSASMVGVLGSDVVSLVTSGASGMFADKNVGTAKSVTVSGLNLSGTDASNYVVVQPTSVTANITAATLTVTGVAASNKVYDATAAANVNTSSASLSGVLGSDAVSLVTSGASGTFADKNVGTGKSITVTGLALSGADAANYVVSTNTATANITAATLTVTGVTASSKVYDASTAASVNTSSASLSGVLGSDAVSLVASGASGTFTDKNVGTGKSVTVTGLTLSGADAANYVVSTNTATANITAATLTVTGVTASSKVYDATTAANVNTSSASMVGVLGSDVVSLVTSGASGAFADKNVGTSKSVSVSGLSLSGADAGNYVVSADAATADITAATLTVTGVTASSKVYDATTAANVNTSSASMVGILGSDVVSLVTSGASGAFADKNVGTSKSVTVSGLNLSGTDAANYVVVQPTGATADITAATLTVTGVTAGSKVYDTTTAATLNTGSAALNGVLGSDAVTLGAGSASGTFADKNVGTAKGVTVSGLSLSGYDATNYVVAQPTSVTADITAATLTVTGVTANSKVYDTTTAATLNTSSAVLSGILGSEVVSVDGAASEGAFADKNVGTGKSVTVTGLALSGADAANYVVTIPSDAITADITAATLTVTGVTASSRVYDTTTVATLNVSSAALNGVLGSDAITLGMGSVGGTFVDKNVGTAKSVTVTGLALSGADAGNYVVSTDALTADITAATLMVSGVTADSKVYDGTTVANVKTNSASLTGVLGSDAVSLVSSGASGTFADKNVGTAKSVSVSGLSLLSGADAGNYVVSTNAVTADITAKSVTYVNANSASTSGVMPSFGKTTFYGVIANDNVSALNALYDPADNVVALSKSLSIGEYTQKVTSLSGADAGNYLLASSGNVFGMLSIIKAEANTSSTPINTNDLTKIPEPTPTPTQTIADSGVTGGTTSSVSLDPDAAEVLSGGAVHHDVPYEQGPGVQPDEANAATIAAYKKAAEKGDISAEFLLNKGCVNGALSQQDCGSSLSRIERAAGQGMAMAQFLLGQIYAAGVRVPPNYEKAAGLFRKAADQGLPAAKAMLELLVSQSQRY